MMIMNNLLRWGRLTNIWDRIWLIIRKNSMKWITLK